MYQSCPKCGHSRRPDDPTPEDQCPQCGLIYSKWLKSLVADVNQPDPAGIRASGSRRAGALSEFFLPDKPAAGWPTLVAYGVILMALAWWGWYFIALDYQSNEIGRSFMHNINLVFHEAGHVIFIPLGRFMSIVGGSLFQVLLPLGLMLAFLLVNKDGFGAAVCLWWAGQSMMDLAPYIADARALRLPLLGGGTGADTPGMHDWANILRQLGLLQPDQAIASAVDTAGAVVVVLALAWAGILLGKYAAALRRQ